MKRIAFFVLGAALTAVPVLRADDAPPPARTAPEGERPREARPPGDAPRERPAGDAPRERPAGDAPREGRGDGAREARPGGDVPRGGVRGFERGQATAAAYIESIDATVSLTDDQKKAITAIFDTRDKGIKDFEAQNADKLKTASKAMEDALQTKDREAISKAQQEYREVFGAMHDIMRKSTEDLAGVLTVEQKAKLEQARVENAIKGMAAPVELTPEQLKQLVALMAGSENVRGALQEKVLPALEQMLTPEQKQGFAKRKVINEVQHSFSSARLTRDQMKEVSSAYDEMAKDATIKHEVLVQKLSDKLTSLLTDEQKAAQAAAAEAATRGRRER